LFESGTNTLLSSSGYLTIRRDYPNKLTGQSLSKDFNKNQRILKKIPEQTESFIEEKKGMKGQIVWVKRANRNFDN